MRDYTITVEKLTDEQIMRKACECTFIGTSKQSLMSIYKTEHSPVRTQIFWIKFCNIPLASATQLLRHHVGSVPFQLTCRDDRNGHNQGVPQKCERALELLATAEDVMGSFEERHAKFDEVRDILTDLRENSDRNTPVDLGLLINAQSLIDMSKMRVCIMAHADTRKIFADMREKVREIDPALAAMMVRKCVYRGGICGESRCCGFNNTEAFMKELQQYLDNYSEKQRGVYLKYVCEKQSEGVSVDEMPPC